MIRSQGEAYRESLAARARDVGVEANVVFLDQFVDQATLLRFISMSDIYVTPYLNEAQMTSGTLAFSFGSGKAVVSTDRSLNTCTPGMARSRAAWRGVKCADTAWMMPRS